MSRVINETDELFKDITWISAKNKSGEDYVIDRNVNPWEKPVDADFQKSPVAVGNGLPMFRRCFGAEGKKLTACTLHTAALGMYDLFVNGKRVGELSEDGKDVVYDELKPGWTDYDKRVLYYSYDLLPFANDGVNCILAAVASGWWQGRISCNTYGEHDLAYIAVIECTYDDGTSQKITTDTSWRSYWGGPVRTADIWDGEIYDACEIPYEEYSKASFDDSTWDAAENYTDFKGVISKQVGPTVRVRDGFDMKPVMRTLYEGINDDGSDFGSVNVVEQTSVNTSSHRTVSKGQTLIYDMGQNMVGWARVCVKGKRGVMLTIRYAEMMNDSGLKSRGNDGAKGSVYTANYRSAKAKAHYILRGGDEAETYRPTYTFYGFRYVELTADDDIEIITFAADVVGSDTRETGFVETSNSDVNKLISNIFWGQRGNYVSIPTDCPQRDERLGWTGDTQIFAGTAAYNADVCGFFHKWLQDARDSQTPEGAYTDVIPRSRIVGAGNAAWGDAGVIVPYVIYRMYGDESIISECYESMEKYMAYLATMGFNGPNPTYGDWLAYEPTDSRYISVAYYAYDAMLMGKMSAVIGKKERAEHYGKLYEDIREHFINTYIGEDGTLTQKTQTAYLLALKLNLLPESYVEEAKAALVSKIRDNGYRLSTGFVGSGIINMTLSEIGATGMAYSLLLQTSNPSWLYSIYQGATTIWERWNSYTLETGFGDVGMNSFNHYAYGAVGEWIYRYMCGIDTDDEETGFKHIILRPSPDNRADSELPEGQERITWVRGAYDSVSGLIESAWRMEKDTFEYETSIPEGTRATLYLPIFDEDAKTITVNGIVHSTDEYKTDCGAVVIELASGRYAFSVML